MKNRNLPYTTPKIARCKNGDWYVYYSFQHPDTGDFKQFKMRDGINYVKDPKLKEIAAKELVSDLLTWFKEGGGPYYGIIELDRQLTIVEKEIEESNRPKYSYHTPGLIRNMLTKSIFFFKDLNIQLTRDVRDLHYRKSIREFMRSLNQHNFVIAVISDEYLRSENCMYEATELIVSGSFNERILAIVLDNARHIFNPENRKIYYNFWKLN